VEGQCNAHAKRAASRARFFIMLLSDLSLHMARSHGFCGAENVYRFDPIKLANLLGCGPDVKPNPPGMVAALNKQIALLERKQASAEQPKKGEAATKKQHKNTSQRSRLESSSAKMACAEGFVRH